jgi:hypothetical protein
VTETGPVPVVPPPPRLRLEPLAAVLLGVIAGVVIAALRHPQLGTYVVAGSLLLGAVLRAVLRPRDAGLLVVRSRHIDVAVLLLLAAGLATLAAVTPFPSGRL